jgi:hypothetical protein
MAWLERSTKGSQKWVHGARVPGFPAVRVSHGVWFGLGSGQSFLIIIITDRLFVVVLT